MIFANRLKFFINNLKSSKMILYIKNLNSIKLKKINTIYKLMQK